MREISQCTIVGLPQPRTWDDYEKGCLSNFGGGHRSDGHLEAFQHGMSTVFNLLRAEFPPAEELAGLKKENTELRAALAEARKAFMSVIILIPPLEVPQKTYAKCHAAVCAIDAVLTRENTGITSGLSAECVL